MYKPNFCAECGERVLRERWRVWTSERFCPLCEKRLRRGFVAPLLVICALVGAGFVCGRLMRPAPPPLTLERGALPLPALIAKGAASNSAGVARADETVSVAGTDERADGAASKSEATNAASDDANSSARGAIEANAQPLGALAAEEPTDPNEVVSICGARTKKGTPCQRRVRGTGRCWQHRGMPAMLPPEKLIVRN